MEVGRIVFSPDYWRQTGKTLTRTNLLRSLMRRGVAMELKRTRDYADVAVYVEKNPEDGHAATSVSLCQHIVRKLGDPQVIYADFYAEAKDTLVAFEEPTPLALADEVAPEAEAVTEPEPVEEAKPKAAPKRAAKK